MTLCNKIYIANIYHLFYQSSGNHQFHLTMLRIWRIFILLLFLINAVINVPQVYLPSNKFISTGMIFYQSLGIFSITSTAFTSTTVSNLYTVAFSGYTRSSNTFKVGFSLNALDIKFNNLKLEFDLKVQSTSTTGFNIGFSSIQANLVTFMKICYITKEPSFQQIFYIQTYRHTGGPFTVGNSSSGLPIQSFTFPLSQSFPAGSVPNIVERSFLNAWNIDGTIFGSNNHIDIYPSAQFPDVNTVMLKLETIRDKIIVNFYSMTVVYFLSVLPSVSPLMSEIQPNSMTQYYIDSRWAVAPGATLLSLTTTLKMYEYNTLAGMKGFHARTYQPVNFLNFKVEFPSETTVQFPTLNSQTIEFMKFQILVFYQKVCPPTEPYFLLYMTDCIAACIVGYVSDSDQNCVANVELKLQYIIKQPDSNKIEMQFGIQPNDVTFNNLYTQLNWSNIVSLDFQTISQTVEYIPSPDPKLKLFIQYAQDLESSDKILTISQYDPINFPINFQGFQAKTIPITKITSLNNLAIKSYSESTYKMGKLVSYLAMLLSGLYMVGFMAGFGMGKVYILEMAFVPQVVFLSLIGLDNISPSMAGLGFLKYVFGYSYTQVPTMVNFDPIYGEGQNYMALIGVSNYFIYNFNIMFVFHLIAFFLFVVFFFKGKRKSEDDKNQNSRKENHTNLSPQPKTHEFFVFDTLLYLVLWFGVWIIFTGEVQISHLIKGTIQKSLLNYLGLAFFGLNIVLYIAYIAICLKHSAKNNSFQQCLKDKNSYRSDEQQQKNQAKQQAQNRAKYFYTIYFAQKVIIASMFVFLSSVKFINGIIAGLHVVMIILLVVFRPYKIKHSQDSIKNHQQQESTFKPIIRPILNYIFSLIIQILFLVTNQIQSSFLEVYASLIILCLLLVQFGVTVLFLVKDQMIKKDIDYLKKLFGKVEKNDKENHFSQVANDTPRKLDESQIKINLLKKKQDLIIANPSRNASQYPFTKMAIDQREGKSDHETESKPYQPIINIQPDCQNQFQGFPNPQQQPREALSIEKMLELMAQKSHLHQLQQTEAESANSMIESAQKILDKVKKQQKKLQTQSKNSKAKLQVTPVLKSAKPFTLHSAWNELQDVDSSRMDKLIEFDKKRKEEAAKDMGS